MNRWMQRGIAGIALGALAAGGAGAADFESTLEQQTEVAVTVYNSGRALVRDRRKVSLGEGEVALRFKDVAGQIMPQTVSLKALDAPGALHILEQNYEYDLMSPSKLMEKYVGKDVRLVNKDTEYSFTEVPAKLLSVNEGPVYQVGSDIYLGHPGEVVLPQMPADLLAQPTLVWLLSSGQTEYQVEATYLTGGIGWSADYVLNLDRASASADIEGWVTLDNNSGTAYRDATLKLVAGEVNVVQEQMRSLGYMAKADGIAMAVAAPPAMAQEAFAEYHLYTLPRKTTIKDNQSKQVSMLTANAIKTTKTFELEAQSHHYMQPMQEEKDLKPGVFLTFDNKEDNNLGMPLPAGVVRVYQEDSSGAPQFAGEDRIQHTPKDEDVRIRLGEAFDVVVDRRQTDFRDLGSNDYDISFEFELRNHKDDAVTVDIVEHFGGEWTVIKESIEHVKRDAATAVFSVPVPAGGEARLTYRAQVRY